MRIFLTNGHRNAGLWITRHLGAAGHRLIAADSRALAFGLRSRFAESFELLPETDAPDYADQLLAAVQHHQPDALIPLGGLASVSARLKEFELETSLLAPDERAFETMLDKGKVYQACEELGIAHPCVLGYDPDTVRRNLPKPINEHPLAVIKPRHDYGAGRGLTFLRNAGELHAIWEDSTSRYGPLIATEFIPGPVDSQYSVQLLFNHESELAEFFVLQKLRQWPAGSGITVEAKSSHEIELVTQMVPLFRQLQWRGPVEIEFKRHKESGRACVLEVNPRFSGTIAFSLALGVDFPRAMLSSSLGQSMRREVKPYYPAGRYYWNPLPYSRSVLRDLFTPGRTAQGLKAAIMPLSQRPAGNPYALTDPSAMFGKLLWQFGDSLRRHKTSPRPRI